MGPNNGENQSGGVATLEPPQTPSIAAPEGGNGLIPTPGASAPEAPGVTAQAESVTANAWSSAPEQPAVVTGAETPSVGTTPTMPEVKPLNSADLLKTPDMQNLNATQKNFFQEQKAAQAAPPKPGLGNRLLGFIGLRGGVKTVVEQPTNAMPDHLKDGVTPQMPNVTPEAAAAANQEPVQLSSAEMDQAMKQGAMDGKAILEPAPDAFKPETPDVTPAVSADTTTLTVSEAADPAAVSAVAEASSIVSNAAGTNAALDEIDKTATAAMDVTSMEKKPEDATAPAATADLSTAAFPSYGAATEASASPSGASEIPDLAQNAAPATFAPTTTEAPSPWPSSPAAEPTTSGPSQPTEPIATSPAIPEYKPSKDMAPAGEAAAPSEPATWSVDASTPHPDATVVGSVPSATEAQPTIPSPEPESLGLESTATPLQGTASEASPPFGTGMPPSMGGATTESSTGITATPVDQPDTMTPTVAAAEPDTMGSEPLSSDTSTFTPEAIQGAGTPPHPAIESPSGNVDLSGHSTGVAEVPGSGAIGQPLQETATTEEPTTVDASGIPSVTETPATESPTSETAAPTDPLTASQTS